MAVAVKTAADGAFVFPGLPAGEYTVSVQAAGFKALEAKNIFVSSSEVRTLGSLTLEIGEVRDSVSVTAEPAAVQLASAEHSGVVTGGQLNEIALKGRDFFALPAAIPGAADTTQSGETTANSSLSGAFIDGARDNRKNFGVDGTTAMDIGANQSVAFIPNMDAIAEVEVFARSLLGVSRSLAAALVGRLGAAGNPAVAASAAFVRLASGELSAHASSLQ